MQRKYFIVSLFSVSAVEDYVQVVDDKEKVSNACILLFGKYPQKFFPRVRMRFIRYEGVNEKVGTEINVIKDVTFEGNTK